MSPLVVPAAAAQHRFDSWTTENGLPQNSVNDIVQTRDGYLWLATHGGLVRFDGVRFVVFDRSTEGIGSQRIRALHEDRRGTLWAGTEDGMLIRYERGRFTTYGSRDGLPHAAAVRIEEDEQGVLWVTWVGSLTRVDGERIATFGPDRFANRVAPPPLSRYSSAWWGSDDQGFHAVVSGTLRTYAAPPRLVGSTVKYVLPDRCGNLWITTFGGDLIKASAGRLLPVFDGARVPRDWRDGAFIGDCHGNVWFLDPTGGYHRVAGGRLEPMGRTGVRATYVDREGSIWFGTVANGLHRLRQPRISVVTGGNGVVLSIVYAILEDTEGNIWIGNGGLTQYKPATGQFGQFWSIPSNSPERVTAIHEDRSRRLWVGTYAGIRYLRGGTFQTYEDPSGFLSDEVSAICEDLAGTLWFATPSGLVRLAGARATKYTTRDGLPHDRITALFEDRSGTLWIGTFAGVARLAGGRFRTYTERDGLVGNQVRAFHEDADGVLWIGTYDGGLYRLAGERLTRYTRNDGLHDNGVFQILEDDDGYLWMGSNRGISRVSRRELNDMAEGRRRRVEAVALGVRDGLASLEINGGRQPAGLKRADGTLWFPTMAGIAVVDPAAFRANTRPPATVIEEVRLAGNAIDFGREVTVPSDTSAFEIRFTAPSFINPEQVRFRYRLAGLGTEWVDGGDRRSVSFYRIPPGHYRFEVVAASHDGVWSSEVAAATFVVLAPFWRTWWFIALTVLVLAATAIAGHELRMRRLRHTHALQERFARGLIESQEGERRRISTELHDSLGHELTMIKTLARATQESSGADRAEKLREIGDVTNRMERVMREIAYNLRPPQLDTVGLSGTLRGMVDRVAEACGIEIGADLDAIDDLFPADAPVHIFRIVQAALNNIVEHSRATAAQVTIIRGDHAVEIKVIDNGTGFMPSVTDGGGSEPRGFGLAGIRQRARMLGGRVAITSGPETGTILVVTLPIRPDANG